MTAYVCMQEGEGLGEEERRKMQGLVNPVYIPRNHLLQEVIAEAEKGNYAAVSHSLPLDSLLQRELI